MLYVEADNAAAVRVYRGSGSRVSGPTCRTGADLPTRESVGHHEPVRQSITPRTCSSSVHPDGDLRPPGPPTFQVKRSSPAPRDSEAGAHGGIHSVKTQRHAARARIAAVGVVAGVLLAGCGAANESAPAGGAAPSAGGTALSGTIAGAGASSQQAAMQAWIAGFTGANPDATITYDPGGSGAGRTQFVAGGVAVRRQRRLPQGGGADPAQQRCGGDVVEVPAYISPIAVVYNLQGVTDLQLAPGHDRADLHRKITNWNDPAIAADNPGETLPDLAITPVNRSDESGTTENFTEYLRPPRPTSGPTSRTAPGRCRAARPHRAPPASSARSRAARARSATPTRARPASSARSGQGRRRLRRARRRRPRRTSSPSLTRVEGRATAASPSTSPATPPRPAPTRWCWSPT